MSVTDFGIGAILPMPASTSVGTPSARQFWTETTALPDHFFREMDGEPYRRQARQTSLSRLASIGVLAREPVVSAEYSAAAIVDTATDQRCHILYLPMPGKIAAAVALPQIVTRVDAFGWVKD